MTRIAGHHLSPVKGTLVEIYHHLHHLARRGLRVLGVCCAIPFIVAEFTVDAERTPQ